MEKQNSSSRSTPVERALKDDPLGRQLHLNAVTPARLVAGFEGLAIGSSINPRPDQFTESLMTFPAYGLAGLALAAGAYAGVRVLDARRAEAAEATQEEIRALIKEPVDVFTAGSKNNLEHTLRWYGADHESTDTAFQTIARYRNVIDFAVEHGLNVISVDAAWASDLLPKSGTIHAPPPMELFGAVRTGPSYISDIKESSKVITDHGSPDAILSSTPEQAYDLLGMMEQSVEQLLLGDIIQRTHDTHLMNEYRRLVANENAPRTRLINQTRSKLEMLLNQETSGVVLTRDSEGRPLRQRVQQHRRVQGEYVHQTNEVAQGENDAQFEITSLLSMHRARNLDELIGKAKQAKPTESQQSDILAAAYLLALRGDKRMSRMSFQQYSAGIKGRSNKETTFQTLVNERKRLGWLDRSSFQRTFNTIGVLSIAATAALGAKSAMILANEYTYADRQAWCVSEEINNSETFMGADGHEQMQDECSIEYAAAKPIESMMYDITQARYEAEAAVGVATLQLISNVAGYGFAERLAPNASDTLSEEWRKRLNSDAHAEAYTSASSMSGLGDVSGEGNQTIYSVDSLDGSGTEGYWYTNTYSQLAYTGGDQIALSNGALSTSKSLVFSQPTNMHKSIEALNAENALSVSTPYVQIEKTMQLPVLAHMEITALRIVDKNNPERSFSPRRTEGDSYTDVQGLYLTNEDVTTMAKLGIETPVLTYWLAKTADDTVQDYYTTSMLIDNPNISRQTLKDIGTTTRESMGLPSDAPVRLIYETIKSKNYSYTPIEDSGRQLHTRADDGYGVIEAWGQQLGSLDALNCNLASTAFLLATADRNVRLNQATGFYDDGDGALTQKEAHAWLVDDEGGTVDPTPAGLANVDRSPEEPAPAEQGEFSIPIIPIAAGLTIGVAGLTLWRRREQIQSALETKRVTSIENDPLTGKALSIIEHSLYGPKNDTPDWQAVDGQRDNIRERLALLPELNRKQRMSLASHISTNPTLTSAERQTVRKVLLY